MFINLSKAFSLWYDLEFYVFENNWLKASKKCDDIKQFAKQHPICNVIARYFH